MCHFPRMLMKIFSEDFEHLSVLSFWIVSWLVTGIAFEMARLVSSDAVWVFFFIALFFTLPLYCALFTAINNCPHHIMKCLCAWQYAACCLTRLQTPFSSEACELKCCCFSTRGQHVYCNPQTPPMSPSLHTPLNVNHILSLHWHWQSLMNIEMAFILMGNPRSSLTFHTICQ